MCSAIPQMLFLTIITFISVTFFYSSNGRHVEVLGGFPIFTAWRFFAKRYDFIWANFGNEPSPFLYVIGPADSWWSMQRNVIVLRGVLEARKAYSDKKSFKHNWRLQSVYCDRRASRYVLISEIIIWIFFTRPLKLEDINAKEKWRWCRQIQQARCLWTDWQIVNSMSLWFITVWSSS